MALYTHKYKMATDQFAMMNSRKTNEEGARRERAREMMEKL